MLALLHLLCSANMEIIIMIVSISVAICLHPSSASPFNISVSHQSHRRPTNYARVQSLI